jgi:hypothetical protein
MTRRYSRPRNLSAGWTSPAGFAGGKTKAPSPPTPELSRGHAFGARRLERLLGRSAGVQRKGSDSPVCLHKSKSRCHRESRAELPIVRLAIRFTIVSWPERADYSVRRLRRFCFAAGRFARLRPPGASAVAISVTSRSPQVRHPVPRARCLPSSRSSRGRRAAS